MSQSAGFNTTLKAGGDPTTLTNAATTKITSNTVYRITNAARRVLDPDTAVVVEVDATGGGSWAAAGSHTVDYFTGTITFGSDQGSSALVRVSGKYIPLLTVGYARSVGVNLSTDELDVTDFESTGNREFILGLTKGEIPFEVVSDAADDLGAGDSLKDILAGRTSAFLEVQPGGQGTFLRCWAFLKGAEGAAPVEGLVTTNLTAVISTHAPAAAYSESTVASS